MNKQVESNDNFFEEFNNSTAKDIIIFLTAEALSQLQGKGLRILTKKFDNTPTTLSENPFGFSDNVVSMFYTLLKIRKIMSSKYKDFEEELSLKDLVEKYASVIEKNKNKFLEFKDYSIIFKTVEEENDLYTYIFMQRKDGTTR